MAKILLINPNKWGRGITHIWIASHSAFLKKNNHQVVLFDATFYKNWTLNEVSFATNTGMFRPTNYFDYIKFKENVSVKDDLQEIIRSFRPDIIFWSAISSHIHSEGEYVNIQNGYDLVKDLDCENSLKITGGLQATAAPNVILNKMPKIDYLIMGESEVVLNDISLAIDKKISFTDLEGIAFLKKSEFIKNKKQKIIKNLDLIAPYNYDLFDDQVFFRPYNGAVVRAVDFELSRGCIFSCSYCVETVIQDYYNFNEKSSNTGAIKNFKSYLRSKSSNIIFDEMSYLYNKKNIYLFRCQDTNFLTNDKKILFELSQKIKKSNFNIILYIETRPEGINDATVELLKDLKVDGVGMGVELASEDFRESNLNRFASQEKTIKAFELLKYNNIKRTSYNVIGFPNQTEESILETIKFNKILNPDNITVAFYSPYHGTEQQKKGVLEGIFYDYEFDADAALRSKTKSLVLDQNKLNYYKENFIKLCRN